MLKQPNLFHSQNSTLAKEALAKFYISTTFGLRFMIRFVAPTRSSTFYAYLVTKIGNRNLKEGHFPEILKIAKVILIYKGDDPTSPSNYRPTSLLSFFDKLLEKLMYNRLDPFFQKHKVFYKYQFGFRKNHATNNALTELYLQIVR